MTIRKCPNNNTTQQQKSSGPTQVSGITEIPFEASSKDVFRLTVEIEQIDERRTKTDQPYYFLQCRDEEGMEFSVVVWSSQFARHQGHMKEGAKLEIDIRLPGEGYTAFSLA